MNTEKQKTYLRNKLSFACVALAVVLVVLICVLLLIRSNTDHGGSAPTTTTSVPATAPQETVTLLSPVKEGEVMVVTTFLGAVSYPAAFIDVIRVSAVEHGNAMALLFEADMGDQIAPLYTLWFGEERGKTAGVITDPQGQTVNVSIELHLAAESLTDSERQTFFAAQETVNDVLASLAQNTGFIAA